MDINPVDVIGVLKSAMLTAPLAVGLASVGPAIGIGLVASNFFQSVARQPEVQGKITTQFFIALGVIELLGLFGFVAFFMTLTKFNALLDLAHMVPVK